MTAILRVAAPYLIGAAVVLGVLFGAYHFGASVDNKAWEAKWQEQAAQLANALASAERVQRDEEQRRQSEIERVRDDARKQIDMAAADVAAANRAAASLREQARRLAASASGSACEGSGPPPGSTPASSPAELLADLFGRADERAGELAAAYDRAHAAGTACERAYDALSAPK